MSCARLYGLMLFNYNFAAHVRLMNAPDHLIVFFFFCIQNSIDCVVITNRVNLENKNPVVVFNSPEHGLRLIGMDNIGCGPL